MDVMLDNRGTIVIEKTITIAEKGIYTNNIDFENQNYDKEINLKIKRIENNKIGEKDIIDEEIQFKSVKTNKEINHTSNKKEYNKNNVILKVEKKSVDLKAHFDENTGIKFPHYSDPLLDLEINEDITFESIVLDVNECINHLDDFENKFYELLTGKNISSKIVEKFYKNRLDFNIIKVYVFFLKRQLDFILVLLKLRILNKENHYEEIKNLELFLTNNYRKILEDENFPDEKYNIKRNLNKKLSHLSEITKKMIEKIEGKKSSTARNNIKSAKNQQTNDKDNNFNTKASPSHIRSKNKNFDLNDQNGIHVNREFEKPIFEKDPRIEELKKNLLSTAQNFFESNKLSGISDYQVNNDDLLIYDNLSRISIDRETIYDWMVQGNLRIDENVNKFLDLEKEILRFFDSDQSFIPSITAIGVTLKVIVFNCKKAISLISQLENLKKIKSEALAINFLTLCNRFELFVNFFLFTFKVSEQDIFNKSENSEDWVKIKDNLDKQFLFSRKYLNKKLDKVFSTIQIGLASVSKGFRNKRAGLVNKLIQTGIYMPYFFIFKKNAVIQSQKFAINPDYDVALMFWNLMDCKYIKNLIKMAMPCIKHSKKYFLKKETNELTIDNLKYLYNKFLQTVKSDTILKHHNSYEENYIKTLDENHLNKNENLMKVNNQADYNVNKEKIIDKQGFKLVNNVHPENLKIEKSSFDLSSKNKKKNLLIEEKINEKELTSYIKVRFISNRCFIVPELQSFFSKIFYNRSNNNSIHDSLIIHIHGGGFIAMSSASHEMYTRKWAKLTNIPIMSIDYRLAPENPYPKALDDVYQAYTWIIKNAKEKINMNLKNIILVGDSAGGNLVAALTCFLVIKNERLPNAIFLIYPALRISIKSFSLSMLNVLDDKILPYHLVKYCLDSYRKDYLDENDPFISPVYADDEILKRFPPTRFYVGTNDPLRDDSYILLKKLL